MLAHELKTNLKNKLDTMDDIYILLLFLSEPQPMYFPIPTHFEAIFRTIHSNFGFLQVSMILILLNLCEKKHKFEQPNLSVINYFLDKFANKKFIRK